MTKPGKWAGLQTNVSEVTGSFRRGKQKKQYRHPLPFSSLYTRERTHTRTTGHDTSAPRDQYDRLPPPTLLLSAALRRPTRAYRERPWVPGVCVGVCGIRCVVDGKWALARQPPWGKREEVASRPDLEPLVPGAGIGKRVWEREGAHAFFPSDRSVSGPAGSHRWPLAHARPPGKEGSASGHWTRAREIAASRLGGASRLPTCVPRSG